MLLIEAVCRLESDVYTWRSHSMMSHTVMLTWHRMRSYCHLHPAAVLLLLPYHDSVVEGTGSQQIAKLRMTPRYLPDWAFVALQCSYKR